ncbi:MAG: hypothetical protein VX483_02730 [Candidatus Thermoplasmatota archaeon]|nr:hypothetical protein [Candidatus Thermoplasmatota archaeon]
MSTQWKLMLEVQSSSKENTDSLAAALITDCEIDFSEDSFSIVINEEKAKDLRAMWNTRVRGLIAVDSLVQMIDNLAGDTN